MPQQKGLSLLELLIATALALLLLGIGVPGFQRLVLHNKRVTAGNELLGAVQYARGEAHARAMEVVLCPSDDLKQCAEVSSRWPAGYLVFADYTPSQPRRIDGDDLTLLARRSPAAITLLANRPAFVFRPHYRRSSNGTVRLCPREPIVAPAALIVSYTGRPRISSRLASGAPVPCPDAS